MDKATLHEKSMRLIRDNGWEAFYQSLVSDLSPEDRYAVYKFYHAGSIVADIRKDRGASEATKMLKVFGNTNRLKYRVLAAAFRFYSEMGDYVDEIADMYNDEQDYRVTQSHLQRVMVTYLTPEARVSYLERAISECLSPDKMYAEIRKDCSRPKGNGRPFVDAETPSELMGQVREVLGKAVRAYDQSWNRILPGLWLAGGVDEEEAEETLAVLFKVERMCRRMSRVLEVDWSMLNSQLESVR